MTTENQVPEPNERDVIKPLDNHTPVAASGLAKKKVVRKPGDLLPSDNHTPVIEPR
ncbi:hypothetical protein [Streptomyces sp. NPDC048516]|uniref:hypothetical protein n=1 Tax=Streptomyces sp. NPDC048516 TaxID=3365565 RepID=UPI003723DAD9